MSSFVIIEIELPASLNLSGIAETVTDSISSARPKLHKEANEIDRNKAKTEYLRKKISILIPPLSPECLIKFFYFSIRPVSGLTSFRHLIHLPMTLCHSGFWTSEIQDSIRQSRLPLRGQHQNRVKNLALISRFTPSRKFASQSTFQKSNYIRSYSKRDQYKSFPNQFFIRFGPN